MQRRPEQPCPSCGAYARVFKNGQSQCAYCGTALAPLPFTHPGGYYEHPNPLRAGMRAQMGGKEFVAVGRVLYEQYSDGVHYTWEEWVLLAQDGEARYLEFDEGKWTLNQYWPDGDEDITPSIHEEGQSFPLPGGMATITDAGIASIRGVEGEIPWPVQRGERIEFADMTLSGALYSVERTNDGVEWFRGRRMPEAEVMTLFGMRKEAQQSLRREENRTDRRRFGCLTMVLALVCLIGWGVAGSQRGRQIATEQVTAQSIPEDGLRLGPITLTDTKHPHRLRLSTAGLSSNWIVAQAVLEDAEGPVFDTDAEFWDESGYDDGQWHEWVTDTHQDFLPKRAGQYFVRLSVDNDGPPMSVPIRYAIEAGVLHGAPLAWFGWIGLLVGAFFFLAGATQEQKQQWKSSLRSSSDD